MRALSYTRCLLFDGLNNIKENNGTFHEEHVDIFFSRKQDELLQKRQKCFNRKVKYSTMAGYYFTMLYTRS